MRKTSVKLSFLIMIFLFSLPNLGNHYTEVNREYFGKNHSKSTVLLAYEEQPDTSSLKNTGK